jgi:hypothetical protein
MSKVTLLTESLLAYGCSFGTIAMLHRLALRNLANGWVRERHPNCYEPVSARDREPVSVSVSIPASAPMPAPEPVWDGVENSALAMQMLSLANAVGAVTVKPSPSESPQDETKGQNLVWSATRSRSTK